LESPGPAGKMRMSRGKNDIRRRDSHRGKKNNFTNVTSGARFDSGEPRQGLMLHEYGRKGGKVQAERNTAKEKETIPTPRRLGDKCRRVKKRNIFDSETFQYPFGRSRKRGKGWGKEKKYDVKELGPDR